MTYPTRTPVNPHLAFPGLDEVDGALRQYFRAEMPQPWPAAPRVTTEDKTTPQPRRSAGVRLFRGSGRLAIAAAVALLVIGYLALQAWFPDPRPPVTLPLSDPFGKLLDRTKSGRPASVEDRVAPNNPNSGIIVIREELPAQKQNRP